MAFRVQESGCVVEPIHDELAAEMRAVYLDAETPPYLDAGASTLLAQGRAAFAELKLERVHLLKEGRDLHLLLWRGTAATAVFGAALAMAGLSAEVHDLGVTLPGTSPEQAMPLICKFADLPPPLLEDAAKFVANVKSGKFAEYVPDTLARQKCPAAAHKPGGARSTCEVQYRCIFFAV